MMSKVYVLKVEEPDLSQIFAGAIISDNPMAAMQKLIEEVKTETNREAGLRNIELLEFPVQAV